VESFLAEVVALPLTPAYPLNMFKTPLLHQFEALTQVTNSPCLSFA